MLLRLQHSLAEDYNLELTYRKPFTEIWDEERDSKDFGPLSERMGVQDRDGRLLVSTEEMEAVGMCRCEKPLLFSLSRSYSVGSEVIDNLTGNVLRTLPGRKVIFIANMKIAFYHAFCFYKV